MSLYQETTYVLLAMHDATLFFYDMAASTPPIDYSASKVIYCGFHRPEGDYKGGYIDEYIKQYSDLIRGGEKIKKIHIYFNNTLGDALKNAQFLQSLMEDQMHSFLIRSMVIDNQKTFYALFPHSGN